MLSNHEKLQLDLLLKDSYIEIVEKDSEHIGVNYNIKLKESEYVDTQYHPLNVTKKLILEIEEILSERNVGWNNTMTVFWINK